MKRQQKILLEKIANKIRKCKKCSLWKTRTNAVPGEGNFKRKILFVGEAPGKNEDILGKPFCGLSGRFFDKMLSKASLTREDIFVTGILKCRPPKNRAPKKEEIEKCKPYLLKQIQILKPKIIVLLGNTALNVFFKNCKVLRLHGKFLKKLIGKKEFVFFITFHPAAAMRFPKIKKLTLNDMLKLKS